jgi:formamidopyrimidine-DNA glycosylase
MPELPEVETIARGLDKRVRGDVIESVWIGKRHQPLKSPAKEIARTLEGTRIAAVRRVGKHIVFDLEEESGSPKETRGRRDAGATKKHAGETPAPQKHQWIVHLGMTGRMQVATPDQEILKHTHAIAKLKSGREVRFVDPRMFGKLSVVRGRHGFEAAGKEPLDIGFELFASLFRKRKTPIKSALLNQKLLSGIGNIYADESLFRAGVRPRRRAASLTRDELRRLYAAIPEVLKEAIAAGGTSVSDYVDAEGEEGFFQLQLRTYGREDEPCLVCKTPIKRVVIGGRSSHYCAKCQK